MTDTSALTEIIEVSFSHLAETYEQYVADHPEAFEFGNTVKDQFDADPNGTITVTLQTLKDYGALRSMQGGAIELEGLTQGLAFAAALGGIFDAISKTDDETTDEVISVST